MKKRTLLILLFFGFLTFSNAQSLKKIVHSETNTSRYKSDNEVAVITEFNFENNKLISIVGSDGYVTKYSYNDKGLVSRSAKNYTLSVDSEDSVVDFEYNSDGYLIKTYYYRGKDGVKNNGSNTTDNRYEYLMKNDKEFTILGKGTCTNTPKTDCMDEKFIMKDNVLTENRNFMGIKTVSVYNFKDGNLASYNQNKNTRENHTLIYAYDNAPSLNETIYKALFGDKYFYALICYKNELTITPRFSKNMMTSSKLEKTIKAQIGIISDSVTTEYNSNNMPVKSTNNQSVHEGEEISPRFLIVETFFYE
jgi:hypothetical protein